MKSMTRDEPVEMHRRTGEARDGLFAQGMARDERRERREKQKERYERLKERGTCVTCGSREASPGKVRCPECAERVRQRTDERKAWLRGLGYCPQCGRERLFGSEKLCPECRAAKAESEAERRGRNPEKHRARQREGIEKIRGERKAAGLCLGCGRRRPEPGKVRCGRCLAKSRELYRKSRGYQIPRHEWPAYGLCYYCGKRPVDKGYKSCSECRSKVGPKATMSMPESHPWRIDTNLAFLKRTAEKAERERMERDDNIHIRPDNRA